MMFKTRRWLIAVAVACACSGWATPASGLALDDDLPGVPLPVSPFTDELGTTTDIRDVYSVALTAGETLVLSLSTDPAVASPVCDLDLYLYGPGATVVDHTAALARAILPLYYPETLAYTAPVTGTYYVEVFAAEGFGPTNLTWSIQPEPPVSVFRFYNVRTGTHFYTSSETERDSVIAKWPTVFAYEGVAYYTKATRNPDPLYRFYNVRNGSHFYTASSAEKDLVIARWSSVFAYEGETYRVSLTPDGGKAPVYRFYNTRNGSHFYTASAEEAATVRQNWPGVYADEGPAFYLGQ